LGTHIEHEMKAYTISTSIIAANPAWLGYQGVTVAYKHLKGEKVEYTYTSESVMMYKADIK
jgi:ABC-type sugar transport system substrate-binding protein